MAATTRLGRHCLAAACALILASATIEVAAAGEPMRFEIASQPLAPALKAFAAQSKMQLLYEQDAVRHVMGNAVVGSFEKRDALRKLLQGTGLEIVFSADDAATIRTKSDTTAAAEARVGNTRLAQADSSSPANEETQAVRSQQERRGAAEFENRLTVEEVIVTAQKRSESLQDVPISMSVLTGADLDRSTAAGVTEALSRVAGVSSLSAIQGGNTLLSVRGATAGGANFNGSSPVAYYLDGVPFSFVKSAFVPDSNAYDMERIEVLRGPQGTLYGASAQNGVVRVLTHGVNLSEFELKGRVSASDTERGGVSSRIDSAINIPLVADRLAARAVVGYQELGGWIDKPNDRDANDGEVKNARLRIGAQPVENLSIDFSSWFSRADYDAASISPNGETIPSVASDPIETDYETYGLRVSYDFGAVSLTSNTGYLDYANHNLVDFSLVNAVFFPDTLLETRLRSKSFSQEVILQSSRDDLWRWSIGAMYRDADDRLYQFRRQLAAPTDLHDTSESAAVFGEVTRVLADGKFEITGGLRYFEDEVVNEELSRGLLTPVPPSDLRRNEAKFHKLSPRAALTWHPTDDLTVYTSYSEGFRSGFPQNGAVVFVAPQIPPLKADNLKNYELGSKVSLWQGRVRLDAAVFYIDWQDIQQTLTVNAGTVSSPISASALVNGQSASGAGAEASLNARLSDGLSAGFNFSWNDLTLDAPVTSFVSALNADVVVFAKGDRLNLSPEYTAGAFVDYAFPLWASGYSGLFSVSGNYTAELAAHGIVGTVAAGAVGDPIVIGRASFSVESPKGWTGTVFVDNFNDENGAPIRQSNLPAAFDTRLRPRTIGAQFDFRF
jgi:outer membrane receptor protein involved in Fe transport